ncbi:uncharacterized protein EKO05_0003042 [Ascochyta rabiei]|uniref:Uncharacterized protein n=1 Tax=Didymella rabiei TaxID=5454 RepID=A0A162XCP8_DIDRA|nr:uncharacterized protein EKO05_0003042 [Ascochyta rabiei]KZM19471.1 hypothetical protein ST47_g9391 [Ascochyta rabiei]UPX12497.1 hypothetical protein EKO05_0003042 [Ascochyta rabiei]
MSQRIASTSTRRTVWRQRGARYYSSQATNDPEWFQQLRAGLLSRSPICQHEDLDYIHHMQLCTTLGGFVPRIHKGESVAHTRSPVAHLLTRFNLQVPSAKLLPDGTDPLHSPGEPWVRRMWAGGAVQVNPSVSAGTDTLGFRSKVACVERIKDVRLQGENDTTNIFVTIERRFALFNRLADRARSPSAELDAKTNLVQQVHSGVEWGDALMKEERNLVFLKAKTDIELTADQTHTTRYLKSPTNPDFTHTLTPTRSLLFRYSALTFNAHLIHLDPTYARKIEGHRNLLVHGPLTLTLMLQTLTKHLQSQVDAKTETVESISYRNLAPLYCDEEMRICVKRKTRAGAGNAWDVWIEGPAGGMAVKATMHTVNRGEQNTTTERAATPLPDVEPVAAQARASVSNALDQEDPSTGQTCRLSREKLRKDSRNHHPDLARSQRKVRALRTLSYLYSAPSPLSVRSSPPTRVE